MKERKCNSKRCGKMYPPTGMRQEYCPNCSSKREARRREERTKPPPYIKPPTLSRKEEEGLSPHQKHKLFVQKHNAQVERVLRQQKMKRLLKKYNDSKV